MKLDFIGIGVNKAATSWIFQCLIEHPDICGSTPKETHFFTHNYDKGPSWYEQCFVDCTNTTLRGEYTPSYLNHPEAIARIHEYAPNAKLLVCLRSPIDRLQSAYYFNAMRGTISSRSFDAFVLDEGEKHIAKSKYMQHIEGYLERFAKKQFHFMIYEDIASDPVGFIQQIYAFLGVDDSFVPPSAAKKVNVTVEKKTKFLWLNKVLLQSRKKIKRMPGGTAVASIIKKLGINRLVVAVLKWNRYTKNANPVKKETPSTETITFLQQQFEEDIIGVETLIGRRLDEWRS